MPDDTPIAAIEAEDDLPSKLAVLDEPSRARQEADDDLEDSERWDGLYRLLKPWMIRVVDSLRKTPVLVVAAKAGGVSIETIRRWRARTKEFDEAVTEALKVWPSQLVEGTLYHVARAGDTKAAIAFLKANEPDGRYRDNKAPVVVINTSPEVAQAIDELFARPASVPDRRAPIEVETVGVPVTGPLQGPVTGYRE